MWRGFEEERGTSRYILQYVCCVACVCWDRFKHGESKVVVFLECDCDVVFWSPVFLFIVVLPADLHASVIVLTWKSVAEGSSRMVFGGVMTERKFLQEKKRNYKLDTSVF